MSRVAKISDEEKAVIATKTGETKEKKHRREKSENSKAITKHDFDMKGMLGEGAYGRVMLAEQKSTGRRFAIKMVDKAFVVRHNKTETVRNERKVLLLCNHPNIVKLHYTFQDNNYLYYVLSLASNGEMADEIRRIGCYHVDAARFYAAELISVLAYLHSNRILHRDLKPENMLLDEDRHLLLTDFGTAKVLANGATTTEKDFVGTAEYVAPEILRDQPSGKPADMWSFGCVLFQMLTGTFPFHGDSEYLTFQKVLNRQLEQYPEDFDSKARDLIENLLAVDPGSRPTCAQVMAHPFFSGVDFKTLSEQTPPAIPDRSGQGRKRNDSVDSDIAAMEAADSDEEAGPGEYKSAAVTEQDVKTWASFLLESEGIVFTGAVVRRRGLFNKTRQLILTDFPRFVIVDPKKMEITGEIQWSDSLSVTVKKKGKSFHIQAGRTMTLKCSNPEEWVAEVERFRASIASS